MPTVKRRILMVILLLCAPIASARAGELDVVGGWVTEPVGNVQTAAAYFTVRNAGGTADRLRGVATPVAARAELHDHIVENGVTKMRRVPQVAIPANETVHLSPGGMHVMLTGLKRPLKAGERVPLTLAFQRAGKVTVELPVRRR